MAKVLTEVFGWSAIALVLIGIWSPEYNGQIFGTAAVSFVLMMGAHANIKKPTKGEE